MMSALDPCTLSLFHCKPYSRSFAVLLLHTFLCAILMNVLGRTKHRVLNKFYFAEIIVSRVFYGCLFIIYIYIYDNKKVMVKKAAE